MLGILSNSFMIATRLDGFAYERRPGTDRGWSDDAQQNAAASLPARVPGQLPRT